MTTETIVRQTMTLYLPASTSGDTADSYADLAYVPQGGGPQILASFTAGEPGKPSRLIVRSGVKISSILQVFHHTKRVVGWVLIREPESGCEHEIELDGLREVVPLQSLLIRQLAI